MLVGPEGRVYGTIGGAIPEHLAIEEAKLLIEKKGRASVKKYILRPNEAADLGARCGGEITVYSRYLDGKEEGLLSFIDTCLGCFSEKAGAWFIMDIGGALGAQDGANGAALSDTSSDGGLSFCLAGETGVKSFLGRAPVDMAPLLKGQCVRLEDTGGAVWLSQPLVAAGFVYVFGGGHVAQELVPLLAHLDFRCIVFDDREEFTRAELFPSAAGIILGEFGKIGESITLGENDYVVIITRGHIWDYDAEAFALKSGVPYIGVIGSKSKHAFVKGRLKEAGFSDTEINAPRVHAPVGIDIKSETPAEIAVSIAAELIRVRAEISSLHK
jgi:xanthine dehydrogenase accessory factor